MYQAIYKCRLCGEEFTTNVEIEVGKITGVDFKQQVAIDDKMNIHNFMISNSHHCKDGSFGFLDFKGIKKAEE